MAFSSFSFMQSVQKNSDGPDGYTRRCSATSWMRRGSLPHFQQTRIVSGGKRFQANFSLPGATEETLLLESDSNVGVDVALVQLDPDGMSS